MLDAAILGDLLMIAVLVFAWAIAILSVALAFNAVREAIRGY